MVKSAARVLTLLELFDAERRPLRVSEISKLLETPQSSVSMLLKTLVDGGYIDHNAQERTFSPSARVAFLANWVIQTPDEHGGIPELMRRLEKATGESVLLGRINGLKLQYLSITDSGEALRFSPSPGTVRPIHRTAIGIMLLSELDDQQIGLLMRRCNAQGTSPAVKLPELKRAIELARESGYYETASTMTPGAGVIATLLPHKIRGVRLGIGIGAPVARLHAKRGMLVRALLAIAREQLPGKDASKTKGKVS